MQQQSRLSPPRGGAGGKAFLKSYIGDVRDADLLRQIFSENDIECVIHFAGLKAVGESVEKPWEYYDNNLNTTLVLTKVMKEVGMKNIIFSSSATVYTSDNEMPLRETSRTGSCTNPYGWTKYMTEQILSGLSHADPDWSVTLLRYFNPIGAHPSGRIGEDPRGIPNNLMPYITQVAIGRRDHLSVFLATITPPRTAPASGTTSTWSIWPRATWRQCSTQCATRGRKSSTWAPAGAPVFWRW